MLDKGTTCLFGELFLLLETTTMFMLGMAEISLLIFYGDPGSRKIIESLLNPFLDSASNSTS